MQRAIHTEEQNENFIRTLEKLDSRWDKLSQAEKQLHELLLLLVQDFERRHYKLRAAAPVEVLAELMAANQLRQKDLVGVLI